MEEMLLEEKTARKAEKRKGKVKEVWENRYSKKSIFRSTEDWVVYLFM